MTMWRIALMMGIMFPSLQACGTATIEDAVPVGALHSAQPAAPPATFSATGAYPNLNVIPVPASEQLTEGEVERKTEELRRRRETLSAGGSVAPSDMQALRTLGNSHADDALKVIEGR